MTPVVLDAQGRICAGHARVEAAKLLGMKLIPVIRATHLNETETRAFALADNKIASMAEWDREILATEIGELQIILPEIGTDIAVTGFDAGEVDSLMIDFADQSSNPADEIPELGDNATARTGDLFNLEKHRLLVGDARDEGSYTRLMRTEKAVMAFLDPPYNVRVDGHVGGRGRIKHRDFACASGEMTAEQFIGFLEETLGQCAAHTHDGGIHFICMDWRNIRELLEAASKVYSEMKNLCVWTKSNAGQGTFYRNQHELVFVYKHGTAAHINNFKLGQNGRWRTNVWAYAGVNSFRAGRMDELKMHPTVKPTSLVSDAIRDCSRRGSIVLDAFAGSGSTIMAAEQIGRRAYCLEIDANYADVAITRWQKFTGRDAVLESTGQTFGEVCAERGATETTATAPTVKSQRASHGQE